ncbi:hypothetical protein [Paludisphaera soli]|uniref:hypothetical protein n=1 Tax=Paludisphaera soli TaxID=2712865 RepID=UPI0013EB97A9|nr:hypothetical protein [Paludisphaera soli]
MTNTWKLTALAALIVAPASLGQDARAQTYRPDQGGWTYDRGYRGYDATQRPRVDPLSDLRRPDWRFDYDADYGRPPRAPGDRHVGPPPRTYREAYRPSYDAYRPAPVYGPSRRVMRLADDLQGQVNSFLQDFTRTAHVVPEGAQFLAEARVLGASADRFRQVAAAGTDPATLSAELRTLEDAWGRLATRTERVSQGRTGPNIERTYAMGDTLGQLRQALP